MLTSSWFVTVRVMRIPLTRAAMLPGAAAVLLLSACAPSTDSLEDAVADHPSVTRVDAVEVGGDDALPFQQIPNTVTVWMDGDATADEVMEVFDEYDDDIADGDVVSVDVILAGSKKATLSSGQDVQVTRSMVDDLVDAQHDETIVGYRREAYPVGPSVDLALTDADFDDVVAAADRYRDVEDLELVEVVSGGFVLIRDSGNEDLRSTTDREEAARQVDDRFGLRGAVVTGRGALELVVDPVDRAAVRRWVRRTELGLVGKVVITSSERDAS
jgi:hypothetical protein